MIDVFVKMHLRVMQAKTRSIRRRSWCKCKKCLEHKRRISIESSIHIPLSVSFWVLPLTASIIFNCLLLFYRVGNVYYVRLQAIYVSDCVVLFTLFHWWCTSK